MDRIRWRNELLIALGFLALSIFTLLQSLAMPVEKRVFLSPGITPGLLSVILIVLSLGLIAMLFVARKNIVPAEDQESSLKESQERELNKLRTKRTIVSIFLTVLYVALLGRASYGILTFAYVLAFLCYFRSTSLLKAIILSAVLSVALVYSFGTLFRVALP
ncbi:MAG: tripartite tricarboxylate transporter TctB family protein [bacterium]|jgi:hypothetical protein